MAGSECRSFARAISVTNPGGEVIAITSGGYGTFQVSGPMTIMAARGVAASITSSARFGINITASDGMVVIRGLNVTMTGSPSAIFANTAAKVSIEGCTTLGGTNGVSVFGGGSNATVTDTVARGASSDVFIAEGRVTLLRCRAENNGDAGLEVDTDGIVTAEDFVAVHNIGVGALAASSTPGHNAVLELSRAHIAHNGLDGVESYSTTANATVRISNSTVVR